LAVDRPSAIIPLGKESMTRLFVGGPLILACLAAESLFELVSFPNLHHLDLADTNLDDTSMAKVAMLQSLRVLNLGGTQVSDGALAQLAKLQQLEELVLTKTSVTNASLHCLADLKKLQSVDLKKTQVTHGGVVKQFGPKGPPFFIQY
jgi:Leucine-rich repeat (LRR) protein